MQSLFWIVKVFFITGYVTVVTYFVGKWAVWYAYTERGYEAVGSEYFLIGITGVAALELSIGLFRILEG